MITSELVFHNETFRNTVERYQVKHFILLGSCEERFMANVVVYELLLTRRTEDITQKL